MAKEVREPTINFGGVPEHIKEQIARDTLAAVKRFMKQPGGKEFLDRKVKEMGLDKGKGKCRA